MELANTPLFFWVLAGLLTLAAVVAALWPLMRRQNDDYSTPEGNLGIRSVLIDQLEEIKRDRARDLINEDEEASARAEVARRLLALEREVIATPRAINRGKKEIYPWVMIVLIPLASVGLYSLSATPERSERQVASAAGETEAGGAQTGEPNLATLVAQVEAHLEKNPKDVRGWQTIAPVYQRQGKLDKAEEAFRNALALGVEDKSTTGVMQNGLGQVLTIKSEGVVSDEALLLFKQAQKNEPRDATGFFFEALALSQAEKRDEAIAAWEAVIARFGQNNPPWLDIANQTLNLLKVEAVSGEGTISDTLPDAPRGPTSEDIEAVRNLGAEDRNELIASMVQGLAARLEENPDNLTGWLQLIRSYIVLGRKSEAVKALEKARAVFKDNTEAISTLEATAQENDL